MSASHLPPGPKTGLFARNSILFNRRRRPLEFFQNMARDYGDIVYFKFGAERVCFINHPDLIKDVLVTHSKNFTKGRGLQRVKILLGNGLLTNEGASHLRQRRLIQPAFHRERVAGYARVMVAHALQQRDQWRDGATVNIAEEMMHLTLGIVAQTLFGVDISSDAGRIGEKLTMVMESFPLLMLPFGHLLIHLPIPALRRRMAALHDLDQVILQMIHERRVTGEDRGDLLSMLLAAQDTEGDGTGMSDEQVRDEAMTIFLAGHETTANALAWTWFLLAQHPEVEARLHAELDAVLGAATPGMEHVSQLTFTEKVVTESMRLYPPAWIVGRRAIETYETRGYELPKRTIFIMSQYVMHRNAAYFPEPEKFNPDRWTPEFSAALPKYAYFPFGGGPRQCIGEGFAWAEAILLIATLAQKWRLHLVPSQTIVLQPLVTLRPKGGIRMTLERREK